jgi:hypothetical protein
MAKHPHGEELGGSWHLLSLLHHVTVGDNEGLVQGADTKYTGVMIVGRRFAKMKGQSLHQRLVIQCPQRLGGS